MVTQMFRPSYFTLLFTLQPITGNRCTYNMHYVCYLRIVQLFESNFKCLSWIFCIFLFCQFTWKCCAFLFISFLHSSLSMTKSLSVWPVLTYFSQRSTHFRLCFRDCLKNLRGLPGFFLSDLIHHHAMHYHLGIRLNGILSTWPAYLSLANQQYVSTAVMAAPLFIVFAQSKFSFIYLTFLFERNVSLLPHCLIQLRKPSRYL